MRVLLALVVALAAACGSSTKSAPPTTPPPQPELPPSAMDAKTQIQQLAGRACACADKKKTAAADERASCARTVVHDFVTFLQSTTETVGQEGADPTIEASERLGKCVIEAGFPAQELSDELKKISPPKES